MRPATRAVAEAPSDLSRSEFVARFERPGRPVLIRGGGGSARALQTWSLDSLAGRDASRKVVVMRNGRGVFDPRRLVRSASGFEATGDLERVDFCLADIEQATSWLASSRPEGPAYYIQQQSILRFDPELLADLEKPRWLGSGDVVQYTNLWVSGRGCRSSLHRDRYRNFLFQVSGRKRLLLFEPSQTAALYPASGKARHVSRVDFTAPDAELFPRYAQAPRSSATLEPGDLLYIPPRWWHCAESLDASISVNYWYGRKFHPRSLRAYARAAARIARARLRRGRGGRIPIGAWYARPFVFTLD